MEVAITAIGTANPKYKRAQLETAELIIAGLNLKAAERRLLRSVYKMTGISERYSVLSDYCKKPGEFEFFPNDTNTPFPMTAKRMQLYRDNALPLALQAIEDCFACQIDFQKNKITHVITVSCTGMYAPGLDIEIVQKLNLNTTVKRTAINFMGCYGAFNALKVAESICRAEENAQVLMVCVELCTIHFQNKMDVDNVVSNAIFADGAAAMIIEKKPLQKKSFIIDTFYCDLLPQTSHVMAWQIADSGFDIVLSSYIPEILQNGIKNFSERLFAIAQTTFKEIQLFAIHPGGVKILQACESALNISEQDNRFSYDVLKNYGNMSSPTVIFVLKKIWESLSIQDHAKKIFSCAFGPGLTLESMILNTNTK